MSAGEGLQFDRAEFENAPAQMKCAECHRVLASSYFDVNGHTVCEACRYTIESRQGDGSAAGRLLKAGGAGFGAAILGSILYYAIAALTGYEIGLIAIVVGFGVGTAVRWGSGGRGGRGYQALAMALTYLAIVSTYIPAIIEGFRSADTEQSVQAGATDAPSPTPADASAPAAPIQVAETTTTERPDVPPTFLGLGISMLFLLAIACIAPFLGGVQNIMGLIIIGIGLYEAWKLNKRTAFVITGPHAIRPPAEAAPA